MTRYQSPSQTVLSLWINFVEHVAFQIGEFAPPANTSALSPINNPSLNNPSRSDLNDHVCSAIDRNHSDELQCFGSRQALEAHDQRFRHYFVLLSLHGSPRRLDSREKVELRSRGSSDETAKRSRSIFVSLHS